MSYLTLLLLTVFSFAAIAEDECLFDRESQKIFIEEYIANNQNAELGSGDNDITISRKDEVIHFNRGGCVHFGISIESISNKKYTDKQFYSKVINLVEEFGSEIIDIIELREAIQAKNWQNFDGHYFVTINNVTVFEMNHDGKGKIYVSFYNN